MMQSISELYHLRINKYSTENTETSPATFRWSPCQPRIGTGDSSNSKGTHIVNVLLKMTFNLIWLQVNSSPAAFLYIKTVWSLMPTSSSWHFCLSSGPPAKWGKTALGTRLLRSPVFKTWKMPFVEAWVVSSSTVSMSSISFWLTQIDVTAYSA